MNLCSTYTPAGCCRKEGPWGGWTAALGAMGGHDHRGEMPETQVPRCGLSWWESKTRKKSQRGGEMKVSATYIKEEALG